jgi:preprotein translocase subunit Sec61beta
VKANRLSILRPGLLWLAAFLALLSGQGIGTALGQSDIEMKVKAAYLLNLIKFTDWPAAKFSEEDAPVVIGCFCNAGFTQMLDRVMASKMAGGRRLVVRRVSRGEDLAGCHVLFVGAERLSAAGALLAVARKESVLSVGESPDFLDSGGMVNFFDEQDTVHIEINPQTASRAGLTLSSRLLTVARIAR